MLVRLMVGAVFLSEGIQKFLFADKLGAGRFLKIGLPLPELLGPFVGTFEILCGVLILCGLLTHFAAVPLLVIMAVALMTTKWPILASQGFWPMAHEARTECQSTDGVHILPRPDQVAHEVIQAAVREPLLEEHECSLDRKPFGFEVGILAGELLAEVMEGGLIVRARRHPILTSDKLEDEVDSAAGPVRVVAEKTPEITALQAFL